MTELNGQSSNGNTGRYRGEEIANQYSGRGGIQNDENEEEIDIRQIVGLLWHNKWIIIL
ncbi:MAG: hypothetical protein LAT52_11475 [Balneolales bacterium]|nr:hypothetical protein [Balneolales bacterium]